jgi:hypothetical protein
MPATIHPQMAPHGHTAFEPEQEMLANCLDILEQEAVNGSGDARHQAPRVWRRGDNVVSDERTEVRGRAVERVAFRHDVDFLVD